MASLFLLGALSALPLVHAHMQMMNPSPFRDPHANRPNEPKDYDILKPLQADGSDFACKGYHLNTPWTTVATYEAGGTYQMQLEGSATHGGGSCQLSMSFDGGKGFKVIKSMEGGCPEQKQYNFTVPSELAESLNGQKTTGLLAWTWFNKIGNREMYMNCAVVDIVPKGSHSKSKRGSHAKSFEARDTSKVNIAAQNALSSYPPLFVANLAKINKCVTSETQDVIFDAPGQDVAFSDGKSGSATASFGKGQCTGTGKGSDGTGSSSSSSSSSPPPPPPGNNGQWNGGSHTQSSSSQSSSSSACANLGDGQYHPECYGQPASQKATSASSVPAQPAPQAQSQQTVQDLTTGKQPSAKVEKELDAYLANLYSGSKRSTQRKRTACKEAKRREPCASPNRWVKRDACTWTCSRKGRRAQTTASATIPTTAEVQSLESELQNLETTITSLMDLVTTKQNAILSRRDQQQPANSTTTTNPSNTFDSFLVYLSRLQTTVVDCIRNIAAATPSDAPVPAIALVAANTPISTLHKRQLIVPDLADWIASMNIDATDPLYSALEDLASELQRVGQLIGEKVEAGDTGALGAVPFVNATSVVNSTLLLSNATEINPLQSAADVAAFAAALSADQMANAEPTLSISTSSSLLESLSLPTPVPTIDPSAAILPFLLSGPGPVIPPPGSVFNLPGPDVVGGKDGDGVSNLENFPKVVDDLGPGAELNVTKFFDGLANETKSEGGWTGDGEFDGIEK